MLYNMLYSKFYVLNAGAGSENMYWKATAGGNHQSGKEVLDIHLLKAGAH